MSVCVNVVPVHDGKSAMNVCYSRVPCLGETVQMKDQGYEYKVVSVRQMPYVEGAVNAIIYVEKVV